MGDGVNAREWLLAQAEVRTSEVQLGGQTFRIREVEADTFAAYARIQSKKDSDPKAARREAAALVLAECVIDETGAPILSLEDATKIAGSVRVSVPLLNRILELSGFGDDEKKA